MVDKEEVYNRLKEIEEGINYLKDITIEMLKNREKFILSKYYLQQILEAIFTISNQIISNENFRKPTSYREILEIIAENNIIDKSLAERLSFAPRLRNELVHIYRKISPEQIIDIKQNKLSIFEEFLKQIMKFIS